MFGFINIQPNSRVQEPVFTKPWKFLPGIQNLLWLEFVSVHLSTWNFTETKHNRFPNRNLSKLKGFHFQGCILVFGGFQSFRDLLSKDPKTKRHSLGITTSAAVTPNDCICFIQGIRTLPRFILKLWSHRSREGKGQSSTQKRLFWWDMWSFPVGSFSRNDSSWNDRNDRNDLRMFRTPICGCNRNWVLFVYPGSDEYLGVTEVASIFGTIETCEVRYLI